MYTFDEALGVQEYSLSPAWDISTASVIGSPFAGPSGSQAFYLKPDGTQFWIAQLFNTRKVHSYTMSPFDLSTAVADGDTFDPVTIGGITALQFSTDGTKMYLIGLNTGDIYQYNLSIPWDITTAVVQAGTIPLTGSQSDWNFSITPDGLEVYEVTSASTVNMRLVKYTLATAWDISTASAGEVLLTSTSSTGAPTFRGVGQFGLFLSASANHWYTCTFNGWVDQYSYDLEEIVTPVFGPVEGYEPVFTMYYDAGVQLWGTFDTDISGVQAFGMAGISERSAILRGESTILFMSGDLAVFNNDGSTLDTSGEGQYVDDDYTVTQAAWVTGGIAQETANIPISITLNESDFGSLTNKFMYRFGVVGTTVGQVTDVTPLLVSWTDDTYRTFSNVRFYDTDHRRILTQLGKFKRRAFKLDYNGEERLRLEELEFTLDGSEFA
jgi:hypothetical protein